MAGTRFASLLVLLLAAAGCDAPRDRQLARPEAVSTTVYQQGDAVVRGVRLRYIDAGPHDAPVLLILPGHTARIEDYDALVPFLVPKLRVVIPDLPGKGYSDKPVRSYTFEYYEEVVTAFLDDLGIARAFVAGGSLGGNLALRLGHRYPDRFPRIVAWAPGSAWQSRPLIAKLIRSVAYYPLFWPAIRIHSRYWYTADRPDREAVLQEKFRHYEEVMGPGFVAMYFDMAAESVGSSLFEIAPAIRQPVLLGWGELDDGAGLAEGVQELSRRLPNAMLVTFPKARHALVGEATEPLAGAILKFLDRDANARSEVVEHQVDDDTGH